MSFVKAYFKPGEGYRLYMPDGTPIPGLKKTTINDEWIDASSKVGESGFKSGTPTAIQELFVEIVNEEPEKK